MAPTTTCSCPCCCFAPTTTADRSSQGPTRLLSNDFGIKRPTTFRHSSRESVSTGCPPDTSGRGNPLYVAISCRLLLFGRHSRPGNGVRPIFFGHDLPPASQASLVIPVEPSRSLLTYSKPALTEETPMREFVRPVVAALSIACLSGSLAVLSSSDALAQAKQTAPAQAAPAPEAALKQMALTEKQIEGVLTAAMDMDAITAKLPEDAKPDPKITAQLDDVAKKNGFASYDEYNDVVDNISMVLAGFDPTSKKYVGTEAVIKAQIAQVQADKKMNAKDKKETLADLNEAMKTPVPPIQNKGNIDLVAKYYDKLADALGDDQE